MPDLYPSPHDEEDGSRGQTEEGGAAGETPQGTVQPVKDFYEDLGDPGVSKR